MQLSGQGGEHGLLCVVKPPLVDIVFAGGGLDAVGEHLGIVGRLRGDDAPLGAAVRPRHRRDLPAVLVLGESIDERVDLVSEQAKLAVHGATGVGDEENVGSGAFGEVGLVDPPLVPFPVRLIAGERILGAASRQQDKDQSAHEFPPVRVVRAGLNPRYSTSQRKKPALQCTVTVWPRSRVKERPVISAVPGNVAATL